MKSIKAFYQNLSPDKAVITGLLTFFLGNYAAGSAYAMGLQTEGKKNDEEPSFEDGKSSITLFLYSLCAISLLIFGYGLCCLALRHPYIVIPIGLAIAVLFSVLAFRSKPKKDPSKQTAANCHYPNTCFIALKTLKQIVYKYAISKRHNKNTQDTEEHSEKANDSDDNKEPSHIKPLRRES